MTSSFSAEVGVDVKVDEKEEKSPSFLRGFHDALRRREPVNVADELPLTAVMASHALAMLPFAVIWIGGLWVTVRMRRGANSMKEALSMPKGGGGAASSKGEGRNPTFAEELKNVFQNAMTPLAPREFRVHVKGTSFKDVLGAEEAVQQVQQYVQFLKTPEKFTRLGGRLPRGCLLTGPPGTGKTLLAKAVAGEADVPFFNCNGADFVELYVGSGPKRVRELFAAAKAETPSVIFIDELDAVGSRSQSGAGGGGSINSEENRTINQLLAELDGLQRSDSVVVFAATNFRENIDKALLRDGRFDRKVELSLPDRKGREALFRHYLSKIKIDEAGNAREVSAKAHEDAGNEASVVARIAAKLAGLTPGVSPATIGTIVNEAAVQAAVAGETLVPPEYLFPAIDDVLLGKRQSARSRFSEAAARRNAWHESGHAMVAWLLSPLQSDVMKVSIVPRHLHHNQSGAADSSGSSVVGGYTQQLGREALEMQTELSLFSDICVLVAGRMGELLMMKGESEHDMSLNNAEKDPLRLLSTGAQDDFQKATQKALENFLCFGMTPSHSFGATDLGLLSYEPQRIHEGRMYQKHSDAAQSLAEEEAGRLVTAASDFVRTLLETHAEALKQLVDALLDKKEMDRDTLTALLGHLTPDKKLGWPLASGSEGAASNNKMGDALLERSAALARKALDSFVKMSEEAALQRTTRREAFVGN